VVQLNFGDVKQELSVRYIGIGPDGRFFGLMGLVLIIEYIYFFLLVRFTSHGVSHGFLHPTEETTLDSRLTRRRYTHLTR
jgi:hypothetical protein